ncbi:phage holin family protein [Cryptosporangium phraense]|uniref:Phage holin family protein n=1 Tax=Cryptosporangium phraense TaxID=2593070 RepID=A0A545ALN5_9ACTN|nr:phage holin family protein [Cryptosporangium phraense]TQS42201.1 phage holin family protein [Cryptosporangium phraense]
MATQTEPAPTPSPGRLDPAHASTAELVTRLSDQVSTLVKDELRLAQLELTEKGKKAGLGAGMFGGAGVVALYGVGALVTAAIAGLAVVLPVWASALIIAVVLFAVAGVLALTGKKEIQQATPPVPAEAVSGVKKDINTVKESVHR